MDDNQLPLFVLWEEFLADLLGRTRNFPKSARFTFANRIDNLALDVMERIIDARFSRGAEKSKALADIDRRLNRLRVLLRLSCGQHYLSHAGFEHLARQVNEAGRMVGGWKRTLERAG